MLVADINIGYEDIVNTQVSLGISVHADFWLFIFKL